MADPSSAPEIPGIEGLQVIGQGGFAVVYRGHQPAFQRDVAVKVIQRSGLDSDDRRRFERECKAMGALSDHPGIVTLYDAGFTADERPYLVMPHIAAGTLHDRLAVDGPIGWHDVTDLGVRLSGALETAHRAGVLHRDIKPANVLRSPYGGQLSDFGIARIQGGHETRTGLVTASLAHAPPEILDGSPPTSRGDVYSLASTLFEALSGRPPFVRDTDEGLVPMMRRIMVDAPPDLRGRNVPDPVATVIERGMEKDPLRRYPTAEAFGRALQGAQTALGVPASPMAISGDPIERSERSEPTALTSSLDTPHAGIVTPPITPDPPATNVSPAVTGGAAPGPDEFSSTTVLPPGPTPTPQSAPPLTSNPMRHAVLIAFVLLLLLAAGVVAFIVLNADDDVQSAPTTVETPTSIETPTSLGPATTIDATTTTATATTISPATTEIPEPPLSAFDELQTLVANDAPQVDLLVERWVPQLSAKREGLDVGDTVFGFPEILADHQARRDEYGAIVIDGATYNFRVDDAQMVGWYITVVPTPFDTADGALDWCLTAGIDRENCVAKFISTSVFEDTLLLNP